VEVTFTGGESSETVKRASGCCMVNRHVKRTVYSVRNNSTSKTVKRFYIDHSADVRHGGYVVTTGGKNCIKSVMGFSRFEFRNLSPLEGIEFVVEEEARSREVGYDLDGFMKKRAERLVEKGILDKSTFDILRQVVERNEGLKALNMLESESFGERDLLGWKERGGGVLEKAELDKVEKVLETKRQVGELGRQVEVLKGKMQKVFQNQARLRDNIKSLEKVTAADLMKRYLTDLDKEEDELKQTRVTIENLEASKTKLEKEARELSLVLATEAKKRKEKL